MNTEGLRSKAVLQGGDRRILPWQPPRKLSQISSMLCILTLLVFPQTRVLGQPAEAQRPISELVDQHIRNAKEMSRGGDLEGAYREWQRIYELMRESTGDQSLQITYSMFAMGAIRRQQGKYREAEAIARRVASIREKSLGLNNEEVAQAKNELALIYIDMNRLSEAEGSALEALRIRQKIHGRNHLAIADSLETLGGLYLSQGRYSDAAKYFRQALKAREQTPVAPNANTSLTLNNLGLAHFEMGDNEKARRLFLQSIKEGSAYNSTWSSTSYPLSNLASLYDQRGDFHQARRLHEDAVRLREEQLGRTNPQTALAMLNLASNLRELGEHKRALDTYNKAKTILTDSGMYSGPIAGKTEFGLAVAAELSGTDNESIKHLVVSLDKENNWLLKESAFLPKDVRYSLQRRISHSYSLVFTKLLLDKKLSGLALKTALLRKGLLQEIERRQSELIRADDELKDMAYRRQALTTQHASAGIDSTKRARLHREIQEVETSIYKRMPRLKLEDVSVSEIAQALPMDGALVEFVRFRTYNVKESTKLRWGGSQYVALVLKSNGNISVVPLGLAKPIDITFHRALSATAEGHKDADDIWAEVSNQLLLPLLPQLKNTKQWFFSPEEELSRVPFAALPFPGQRSRALANVVQLRLLTSGRDIVRLRQLSSHSTLPVVIANPDYGQRSARDREDSSSKSQKRAAERFREYLVNNRWQAIPGTEQEGLEVAKLLGTTLLSGKEASTKALERLESPIVLHIATHGFFLEGQELGLSLEAMPLYDRKLEVEALLREKPIFATRSGLVFAGANTQESDSSDDGYLTAEEAVDLNLEGTELVVLSACSTGQGEVRTGEGVYGLQRSLTVAGARSTLLSLWKVDDTATAEFMTRFYKRLKTGEGRADALAAVQKEFRNGIPGHDDWKHPYFWAAWQLVGDWRPIKGL